MIHTLQISQPLKECCLCQKKKFVVHDTHTADEPAAQKGMLSMPNKQAGRGLLESEIQESRRQGSFAQVPGLCSYREHLLYT